MPRIGITGHIHLAAQTSVLVRRGLADMLEHYGGDLVGVSCLAPGADTIFASVVLASGGKLEVVLPTGRYRDLVVPAELRSLVDELLDGAATVRVMCYDTPSPEAYQAANHAVLAMIERLVAVWDGGKGAPGSSADMVASARMLDIPVDVVWPVGSRRISK